MTNSEMDAYSTGDSRYYHTFQILGISANRTGTQNPMVQPGHLALGGN